MLEQTRNKQIVEEKALIKAFQSSSDNSAFDKLVIKYQDKVFNLCYRFMGDYHEANDCAQDTFVKVFSSLKKFKGESEFSTWLYRIAVNTCKNKLSSLAYRLSKIMVHLDRAKGEVEDDPPVEIKDESRSPEVELEIREREKMLQVAINSLPEDQKTVVILRDIEGLSYDEIAGIAGYNLGTVKSKLFRARDELRNKLRGKL